MPAKRKNLVLKEELLEEGTRLNGERADSRALARALGDFVRRAKAGRILELAGSGLWEGDLGEMRGEPEPSRPEALGARSDLLGRLESEEAATEKA